MTQWSIWGGFMKKTRGQKSRATVPLKKGKPNRACEFTLLWATKKWKFKKEFQEKHNTITVLFD